VVIASLEEVTFPKGGEYVAEFVIEVELAYGAVVFMIEPDVDDEVCGPWELIVLAELVINVEDIVDFHSMEVLVGKGKLVGWLVMMEVLMSVRLLADVGKDPTELISDSMVLEKL
jgi:hypothetical protein